MIKNKQKLNIVPIILLVLLVVGVRYGYTIYKYAEIEMHNKNIKEQSKVLNSIIESGNFSKCDDLSIKMQDTCYIKIGIKNKDTSVCEFSNSSMCEAIILKDYEHCERIMSIDSLVKTCKELIDDWNS